jgi:hypothetical protein
MAYDTCAPMNEAIRRENCAKKTLIPSEGPSGIWQNKFPMKIKLIFVFAYIFLNFLIIMSYSQENCIDV